MLQQRQDLRSTIFTILAGMEACCGTFFGADAIKLESSYNRSVKCTMNLPLATHRCLIEALSERHHLKWFLINRFLSFLTSMEKSNKPLLKVLKEVTERDTMSRTGRNWREILMITGKNDISRGEYCYEIYEIIS